MLLLPTGVNGGQACRRSGRRALACPQTRMLWVLRCRICLLQLRLRIQFMVENQMHGPLSGTTPQQGCTLGCYFRDLGGHVRGGSLIKPVRGGADWHGARSTGIDRLDVASGGRQHSLSFILWSILTTLTHTHLHQCSVSLVFISQRTPSGLLFLFFFLWRFGTFNAAGVRRIFRSRYIREA